MPCTPTKIQGADGKTITAIVCTPTKRCGCKKRSTKLCDWKVTNRKSGTCDKHLCDTCATPVGIDKDLCLDHAAQWQAMLKAKS